MSGDLNDNVFQNYTGKHAIKITSAGTYNWSNVSFDGSGTNDVETTHASGTVTINISNGGDVPTVTETGAGAVVVNNNVTIRVTATDEGTGIEGAYVRVVANETVGTITTGDVLLSGLTNASGIIETTTFNYEAAFNPSGLDILISIGKGSEAPTYKRVDNFAATITTAGSINSIPMQSDD